MPPGAMKVLLVESNESYAAVIGEELKHADIEVRRAPSLAAARSELSVALFDAIVLDLSLPDSSGVESVEALHDAAGIVPILVLTSNGDEGLSALALQRGAQDYLLKGEVDGRALARALRYARDRSNFRQSMRDRETRFRALVENSSDAITLLDEHGRVIYDSRSIVRVMGYTPEERIGQSLGAQVHDDDRANILKLFGHCLDHPDEIVQVEYRFRHKDGSWRWGQAIGVNRLHDPTVQAVVVNHRDITDRKTVETALRHSEEQLRQAQKMEAVGRLAGGVAHDFNNVLTAIFGYTDLLLDQFSLDDPRRSDVEEIRRAAERAASLTRQLLAFSRKQIMQPRLLDLNEVITSVRKLLSRLIGEDIRLEIQTAPDLVKVRADPGQLEQVLMNLAANARDAMPEGGTLAIATRTERVQCAMPRRPGLHPGTYAVIEVVDSGAGMPEDVRERIFEPFFTTKDRGKGTGLGLATVYGIVKQTGGGIYVDSQQGEGTTFVVYLPEAGDSTA